MMNKLTKAIVITTLVLTVWGCKREAQVHHVTTDTANNPTAQKMQAWLKGQPQPTNISGRKAANALPLHTLQWGSAYYNEYRSGYTVHANINTNKADGCEFARLTLLAKADRQGNITEGQYLLTIPNRKKMGDGAALSYNSLPLLFADENNPPTGFSGAVLQFDMDGQLANSHVYVNGTIQQGATANLAAREEGDSDPSPNTVVNICNEWDWVCIEWFYQTYVNGDLVDEEYLYTTCCGNTSSGGGGGGTSAEEACANDLIAFANQGQAEAGPVNVSYTPMGPNAWEAKYNWRIYRDAPNLFEILSSETGIMRRPDSNTGLTFESLRHDFIRHNGYIRAGGTRTYQDLGATTSINLPSRITANINLTFSVTSCVPCNTNRKETITYSKSKTFSVIGATASYNPD